jgi:Zn-dependent peptidase ImmA (M78 family)
MSNDYSAKPLSHQQIEMIIAKVKAWLSIGLDAIPDILEILKRDQILTEYGIKSLSITIVPDGTLDGDEARTIVTSDKVEMQFEHSIWTNAISGHPRSLMTLRHELGHAVLHEKPVPLARSMKSSEVHRPNYIQHFESAEHQANYFAAAFQMSPEVVARFSSAGKLAAACRVSLPAAKIRNGSNLRKAKAGDS